jgi:hypothetical protein
MTRTQPPAPRAKKPDKAIHLRCRRHPFEPRPATETVEVYRRQRLTTLIRKHAGQFNLVNVWVNSNPLQDHEVTTYRCRRGDVIVIAPRLGDLSAAVIWLGNAIAGPGTYATAGAALKGLAVSAAISVGLSYGINALLPKQSIDAPDTPGVNPEYSFGAETTQAPGLPMEMAFGRNRHTGNLIAWYTHLDDADNETRRIKVSLGYGPRKGPVSGTLKLQDEPAANFTGIAVEHRTGSVNQLPISFFDIHPNETWPNQAVTAGTYEAGGPVTFTTRNADFDDLRIYIYWRSRKIDSGGQYENWSIGLKIEISEHLADSWTTLVDTNLTNINDNLKKNIYDASGTYDGGAPVTITRGTRYDIRVTKTTPDYDPNSTLKAHFLEEILFKSVQEIINTAFEHPSQPLLAVSAIASEKISGSLSVSEEWDDQVVEIYDGDTQTWTIDHTYNPAWIIHYLITLPLIDGGGTDLSALSIGASQPYGWNIGASQGTDTTTDYSIDSYRGYDPADIGNYAELLDQLWTLAQRCDELVDDGAGGTIERHRFCGKFERGTNVWEAIKQVANHCHAEVRPYGNGFRIYIEKEETEVTSLYSAGNIMPGTFNLAEIPQTDKASRFEMTIFDADNSFDESLVPFDASNYFNEKTVQVNGFGFSNQVEAWRHLYVLAGHNDYDKWVCNFEVPLHGLSDDLYDVIYTLNPKRRDGLVQASSGAVITLDKAPVQSTSDVLALTTHNPDTGLNKVEVIAVKTVSGRDVTLASAPTVPPVDYHTVYAFGPEAVIKKKWRIKNLTRIAEKGNITHRIECVEYHDEIYPAVSEVPKVDRNALTTGQVATSSAARPTSNPAARPEPLAVSELSGALATAVGGYTVPILNLSAGQDLTDYVVYVAPDAVTLLAAYLLIQGTPQNVNDANPVTVTLENLTQSLMIVTKTFDTTTVMPTNDQVDLGTLANATLAAGDVLGLTITQNGVANTPASLLTLK